MSVILETLFGMALLSWYRMISPVATSGEQVDEMVDKVHSSISVDDRRFIEIWLSDIADLEMDGEVEIGHKDDAYTLMVKADGHTVYSCAFTM